MANFRAIGGGEVSASINDPNVLLPSSAIIEPTLTTGTRNTAYITGYYKVGTRVYVSVGVTGLTAGDVNTIFTLPVGFRPLKQALNIGTSGAMNTTPISLIAFPDGKVNIYTGTSQTAGYATVTFDAVQ